MITKVLLTVLCLFGLTSALFAETQLQCSVDLYRAPSSGGGAILGGSVKTSVVTVTNAGIPYSTIADRNGKWAIHLNLLATSASTEAWSPGANQHVTCADNVSLQ